MKTSTIVKSVLTSGALFLAAGAAWTASFTSHPNATKLQVVPEWNGPDFKVHYTCKGKHVYMKGLAMDKEGDTVVVNYGALGRRRGFRTFKCLAPSETRGAATR